MIYEAIILHNNENMIVDVDVNNDDNGVLLLLLLYCLHGNLSTRFCFRIELTFSSVWENLQFFAILLNLPSVAQRLQTPFPSHLEQLY